MRATEKAARSEAVTQAWRRTAVVLLLSGAVLALMLLLDRPLSEAARHIPEPWMGIAKMLTHAGKSHWYLIPAGLTVLVLLAVRHRTACTDRRRTLSWIAAASGFVFLSVAVAGLAVILIKLLVGRARPKLLEAQGFYGFDPLTLHPDFHGFPSGHASTMASLALALGFLLPRWRLVFLLTGIVLASTRIWVNAHFASDVVAGIAIAVATTYWLRAKFTERGWLFVPHPNGRIMAPPPWRAPLDLPALKDSGPVQGAPAHGAGGGRDGGKISSRSAPGGATHNQN